MWPPHGRMLFFPKMQKQLPENRKNPAFQQVIVKERKQAMVFSSLAFLFVFLPLFLGFYYLVPARLRRWPLLLGSFAFYAYGAVTRPWILLLFFGLTIVSFQVGRALGRQGQHDKLLLTLTIFLIFGCLLGFKYAGLFGARSILLPLGMSFYSFQMAAYLFDVRARRSKAEKTFLRYLNCMLFFPKLISGPLASYDSIAHQMDRNSFQWERFHYGLQDFLLGLAMKTLLADRLSGLWQQVQTIGFDSISTPLAWLGLASFSLQLYFDFFGYSLMAIGLGRMLGFRLPKNFVIPYTAHSMSEFWRRWHITLGRWFLDYVYIPLGGSRRGKRRELLNLLIVWLLTGIWHGATPNFLLWGLFIFVLMALEKIWLEPILERSRIFSHLYLLLTVMLSWMLFAITDLSQIAVYFGRLFPFFGAELLPTSDFMRLGAEYLPFLLMGALACTAWFMRSWDKLRVSRFATPVLFLLFWLSVYCLTAGLNDPFLYFSF